jgi:hypothetical protein
MHLTGLENEFQGFSSSLSVMKKRVAEKARVFSREAL